MRMLVVPQMVDTLAQLDEAHQIWKEAGQQLDEAAQPYEAVRGRLKMKVADLRDEMAQAKGAMMEDPAIISATEKAEQATVEYNKALEQAKGQAAQAWEEQATDGSKQWLQSGFEVRLQETPGPNITDPMAMLGHLVEIDAMGIVEQVDVKLNRKQAIALREAVEITGLEIDVQLSCSIKSRDREVSNGE